MKKIVNLLFEMDLDGQGIVNYDSVDQKYIHNSAKTHLSGYHENITYAKKNFYTDPNGKTSWKIKISSDCLRKNLFKDVIVAQTQNTQINDFVNYSDLFSVPKMLKGWLPFGHKDQIKRSSSLNITDAEQTNNVISILETFSKSGEKTEKNPDLDQSDNTFYKKETVGHITYKTRGNFDLMNLQFFSADQLFDRYSFNPDKFHLVQMFLSKRLPNFDSELGYYQIKNSSVKLAERGFVLSNDNVVFLIKEGLKRLFNLNISKRISYAKRSSMRVKLVEDPFTHTYKDKDNWIEISSIQDIDNLQFEVVSFYESVSPDDAKKQNEGIVRLKAEVDETRRQNDLDKKEKARQRKEKKEKEKTQ